MAVALGLLAVGAPVFQGLLPPWLDALLAGASGVIVFHNHPSGDPSPSPEDVALTHRLQAAGKLVGVVVLDHLIIGDTRYFSMRESGGWL